MKTLLYSDEGRSKDSKPYHTTSISIVTPEKIRLDTTEGMFVCHAQWIMTCRDQGRKLGRDISRVSTYHDSNMIGHHRNVLPQDKGGNKVSKPDFHFFPNRINVSTFKVSKMWL